MTPAKNTGVTRLIKAIGYSFEGLKSAFSSETAFRQELLLFTLSVPMALMLAQTPAEKALMIGSVFLVLIVEIINTAFETTIERISAERHDLSKKSQRFGKCGRVSIAHQRACDLGNHSCGVSRHCFPCHTHAE